MKKIKATNTKTRTVEEVVEAELLWDASNNMQKQIRLNKKQKQTPEASSNLRNSNYYLICTPQASKIVLFFVSDQSSNTCNGNSNVLLCICLCTALIPNGSQRQNVVPKRIKGLDSTDQELETPNLKSRSLTRYYCARHPLYYV